MAETKINVILTGGGYKGCYQAGFLHYLQQNLHDVTANDTSTNFVINEIYGTSIGGLNGYLFSQHKLHSFWKNISNPFHICSYWIGWHIHGQFIIIRCINYVLLLISVLFGFFFKSALFSNRNLPFIINDLYDDKPTNKLTLCVHNITDNTFEYVPFTNNYLYACCSLWMILPPCKYKNKYYCDAGSHNFIPYDKMLETTYDEYGCHMKVKNNEIYLIINAFEECEIYKPTCNLLQYLNNIINATSDAKRNNDYRLITELNKFNNNIKIYNVNQSLIKNKTLFSADRALLDKLWENGEEDCKQFFASIKQKQKQN